MQKKFTLDGVREKLPEGELFEEVVGDTLRQFLASLPGCGGGFSTDPGMSLRLIPG